VKKVRLTLDVSKALHETLIRTATKLDTSYAEVLRRAIALMEIGVEARARGLRLGIADEGATHIHTRILL
jgi:hypothetical protein